MPEVAVAEKEIDGDIFDAGGLVMEIIGPRGRLRLYKGGIFIYGFSKNGRGRRIKLKRENIQCALIKAFMASQKE